MKCTTTQCFFLLHVDLRLCDSSCLQAEQRCFTCGEVLGCSSWLWRWRAAWSSSSGRQRWRSPWAVWRAEREKLAWLQGHTHGVKYEYMDFLLVVIVVTALFAVCTN